MRLFLIQVIVKLHSSLGLSVAPRVLRPLLVGKQQYWVRVMSDENQQDEKFSLEETFERGLFASRWLIAPMCLGLVFALAMLTFIFCRELLYYMPQVLDDVIGQINSGRVDAHRFDLGREPFADRAVFEL